MKNKKITAGLLVCLALVFIITVACLGLFAQSGYSNTLLMVLFLLGAIAIGLLCGMLWEIREQS